ncbi:MAG: hypothetical protein ACRC6T_01540 [Sarcina sp.]
MKIMTIRLEDVMHKAMKIKMANDENTLQEYIVGLISDDLDKEKKKK